MKVIIKATAPTVYQVDSLRSFNLGVHPRGDGAYYGEEQFNTKQDAKEYLIERAEMYFDTPQALRAAKYGIRRGCLTFGTVTAYIEPLNNKS